MIQFAWYNHKFEELVDEEKISEIKSHFISNTEITELPLSEECFEYCIHTKGLSEWQVEEVTNSFSRVCSHEWVKKRFNPHKGILTLNDKLEIKDLRELAEEEVKKETVAHHQKLKEEKDQRWQEERLKNPIWSENGDFDETSLRELDTKEPEQTKSNTEISWKQNLQQIHFKTNEHIKYMLDAVDFAQLDYILKQVKQTHRHLFIPICISLEDIKRTLLHEYVPLEKVKGINLTFIVFHEGYESSFSAFAYLVDEEDNEMEFNVDLSDLYSIEEAYKTSISSHEIRAMFSPKLLEFIKEHPDFQIVVNQQNVLHEFLLDETKTKWYDFEID